MLDKKIVFLGTPFISAYLLESMIKSGFNIVAVITQEDKRRGRKNILTPSEVSNIASKYNIPCYKPAKLNREFDFLKEIKPDLLLTFAYGQIISDEVLSLSKYKPLNLHASLLPRFRGASPIQYALRYGDKKTGICMMEMVKKLDAGDIYASKEIDINEDDNYTSLSLRLANLACDMVNEYLPLYFENKLVPQPQSEEGLIYAYMISKEDEHLNLNQDPVSFVNQVRSLAEIPGGYLLLNDFSKLKIYKASVKDYSTNGKIGEIIIANKSEIVLQLEKGTVRLEILQKPGKNKLTNKEFFNGNNNFQNEVLK